MNENHPACVSFLSRASTFALSMTVAVIIIITITNKNKSHRCVRQLTWSIMDRGLPRRRKKKEEKEKRLSEGKED